MGKGVGKAVENINQHLGPALKVHTLAGFHLCVLRKKKTQVSACEEQSAQLWYGVYVWG